MTAKKVSKGLMPEAHPTAPGGMSQKALIAEMVERHGFDMAEAKSMKWPEQIDAVIKGRLREDEARREQAEQVGATASTEEPDVTAMFDDEGDDVDDMLAELGMLTDEASTPQPSTEPTPDEELAEVWDEVNEEQVPVVEDYDTEWMDPEAMFADIVAARAEHEATLPPPVFIGLPGVRDYIFDGHAGAGPSGAERWMNCTMSLTASRKFLETLTPNQQRIYAGAGSAARQGTTAHGVAETEANHILGRITEEEVEHNLLELSLMTEEDESYDDEMAEYVTEYVDLVRGYAQERGDAAIRIESRVEAVIPLAEMHEGEVYVIRGSADFAAMPVPKHTSLVVGDLKYGKGIDVDVDENPQIRMYALGMLGELADDDGALPDDLDEIIYYIVQPRLGGIKEWRESVDDLLAWRDDVLSPALTEALYGEDEGATFSPSDLACQWCPARGTCPALAEQRIEQAADLFNVVTEAEYNHGPGAFPETSSLTDTRLGELLVQIKGIIDLYPDLKSEAERRMHRGDSIPGFKLVSYTPARKWKPSAATALNPENWGEEGVDLITEEQMRSLYKPPTLVSPTQAEKALGKEVYPLIEALVEAPDKRPIIAPESSNRKTWEGRPPEQMFPDEEGDE